MTDMLNDDEDIFGEVRKDKVDRLIARDDPVPVEYSESLQLAKETGDMAGKEDGWHLVAQRPMRCENAPRDWICNVGTEHGRVSPMNGLCYCSNCYIKKFPQLHVGDPVATAEYSVEELKERGTMGLYQPPPPHIAPCPLCGVIIESYEEIDSNSEMVHTRCLSPKEREVLTDVGYNSSFLIRKKREDHAPDRTVAGGSSDHECPDCRCSEQDGGEPIQSAGEEEGPLVGQGRGRSGERSGERGVDVHSDEAGQGAEAGSEEADAGGQEEDAEDDISEDTVLHTTGIK